MKQISAFLCDFCPKSKLFKTKASGSRHEKNCYRNPETHSCVTCGNFEMVYEESYSMAGGEVIEHPYKYPYCEVGLIVETPEDPARLHTRCEQWIPKEQIAEATA